MMSLEERGHIFWESIEKSIFEVISLAIDKFIEKDDFPLKENQLNRNFYFCLVSANCQLRKQNKGLESPPFYEGNIQPSPDDKQQALRELKRPDFQWSISDTSESPERSSKQFVLECKRLGKPSSRNWIFNKNHVQDGIKRFIDDKYGYGDGVKSSAMLGYIQNMCVNTILSEVNREVKSIQQPLISNQIEYPNHTRMSHKITKNFPLNTIELKHIWIEIDSN